MSSFFNYDGNSSSFYNYDENDSFYRTHGALYDPNSDGESSQITHGYVADHRYVDVDSTNTYSRQNYPVFDVEAAGKGENKIGLKLTKTPSLLNIVDGFKSSRAKNKQRGSSNVHQIDNDDLAAGDKLKAANFPALSIQIGSWRRESRYEGDLVAKCYFKKRKLVWEALDGNLKTKIEFPWSDIIGIRRISTHGHLGILDIMVAKSPLFFREVNPQPRKHTNWEQTDDFTNNQASLFRKHKLEFAPGILEKHYDKIIQADPKLQSLSQQRFPDHLSSTFHEINFSNNIGYDQYLPSNNNFLPRGSSTNYSGANYSTPSHDLTFNQNNSSNDYQNFSNNYPQSFPNHSSNYQQSSYATLASTTGLDSVSQHGSYVQPLPQLSSYEQPLPYYTSHGSSHGMHDIEYHSSNDNDYHSQYNYGGGGSQW